MLKQLLHVAICSWQPWQRNKQRWMTPVEEEKEEMNKYGKRGGKEGRWKHRAAPQLPLGMERYLQRADMMKLCAC